MKARIKNTGEIIKIADYATIALDKCDSWGNPIEVKPEDIELIQEVSEDEHWQDVRERAAIAAMQGIIESDTLMRAKIESAINLGEFPHREVAKSAIFFADSLVKQLRED